MGLVLPFRPCVIGSQSPRLQRTHDLWRAMPLLEPDDFPPTLKDHLKAAGCGVFLLAVGSLMLRPQTELTLRV